MTPSSALEYRYTWPGGHLAPPEFGALLEGKVHGTVTPVSNVLHPPRDPRPPDGCHPRLRLWRARGRASIGISESLLVAHSGELAAPAAQCVHPLR